MKTAARFVVRSGWRRYRRQSVGFVPERGWYRGMYFLRPVLWKNFFRTGAFCC